MGKHGHYVGMKWDNTTSFKKLKAVNFMFLLVPE